MPCSGRADRLPADDLAVDEERTQQRPVTSSAIVGVVARGCRPGASSDPNQLANCDPLLISCSYSPFAPATVDLALGPFDDGDELLGLVGRGSGDQLVHQADGGSTAPCHEGGADAVRIHRSGCQRSDLMLVEVAGDHDSGVDRTK